MSSGIMNVAERAEAAANPRGARFTTITGEDWARELPKARRRRSPAERSLRPLALAIAAAERRLPAHIVVVKSGEGGRA